MYPFFVYSEDKDPRVYHEYEEDVMEYEAELDCMREFKSTLTAEDEFSHFKIIFAKYKNNNTLNEFIEEMKKSNDEFLEILKQILSTSRQKSLSGKKEVVRHVHKIKRKMI